MARADYRRVEAPVTAKARRPGSGRIHNRVPFVVCKGAAAAAQRLPVLQECGALWLEEQFVSGALGAYMSCSNACLHHCGLQEAKVPTNRAWRAT